MGYPKVYWEGWGGIQIGVQAQWNTSFNTLWIPASLSLTPYTHRLYKGEENTENLKGEDRGEERGEFFLGKTY